MEEQVIPDECGITRLGNDLFMTYNIQLFRNLFEESANFIQIGRFGDSYSIERRYPPRKTIKEVVKSLEIPINQDIGEIIVGFCVEWIQG